MGVSVQYCHTCESCSRQAITITLTDDGWSYTEDGLYLCYRCLERYILGKALTTPSQPVELKPRKS